VSFPKNGGRYRNHTLMKNFAVRGNYSLAPAATRTFAAKEILDRSACEQKRRESKRRHPA
jgi:hypothetical protein